MSRIRKIGTVMWVETAEGTMKPEALENLSENDLHNLNKVYEFLVAYKKTKPVLHVIVNSHWDDMPRIREFLEASLSSRVESREMKASDDWHVFWNSLN